MSFSFGGGASASADGTNSGSVFSFEAPRTDADAAAPTFGPGATSDFFGRRSRKHALKGLTFPDGFKDHFRCNGCKQYLRRPIWMCKKGHNNCSKCTPKGAQDKCSLCGNVGLYPNGNMEEMVWELGLPISCQNHPAHTC